MAAFFIAKLYAINTDAVLINKKLTQLIYNTHFLKKIGLKSSFSKQQV
ncbi:hypothetical protein SPPR111872_09310 [Sphingobacterium prati]